MGAAHIGTSNISESCTRNVLRQYRRVLQSRIPFVLTRVSAQSCLIQLQAWTQAAIMN